MTRSWLAATVAAAFVGPWAGCDREPVAPPATPPGERAPAEVEAPDDPAPSGPLLIVENRRYG